MAAIKSRHHDSDPDKIQTHYASHDPNLQMPTTDIIKSGVLGRGQARSESDFSSGIRGSYDSHVVLNIQPLDNVHMTVTKQE